MKFEITDKWVLLMRHAAIIWGPGGRIRLVRIALNIVGRHHRTRITSAPEDEAKVRTAEPIFDSLMSDTGLQMADDLEEVTIENALAEKTDEPLDALAGTFKARRDTEIVVTHFARLEPCLDALRRVFAVALPVPSEKMRHLNKAYLINLTTGTVYVLKEKS